MSLCLQSLEGIVFSAACFQFCKEDSYFHSQLEYAQAYQIEEETWADESGGFEKISNVRGIRMIRNQKAHSESHKSMVAEF
jgi:hypothetical protein